MKENLSIKFFLLEKEEKSTSSKLFLRIIADRKKSELFLGYSLNLKDWDESKQRAKKDKGLNEELCFIENKIHEIRRQLIFAGKPVTAKSIKRIYSGEDESNQQKGLLIYFYDHIEKIKKLPQEHSSIVVKKYLNTYNKLKQFLISKKRTDLTLSEINYQWLSDFDFYMLSTPTKQYKKPLTRNTANKQHGWLRSIFIKGVKEGYLNHSPYRDFKLKDNKSTRMYLNQKELDSLIQHSLAENPSLQKVRDIFIFSVYTGLRYSDAIDLKPNQVSQDKEGRYWIQRMQTKTKEQATIPMLKPAVEIYKKYDDEERKMTGFVLPRLSNQKLNSYLKIIADLVGIDKPMTHHIARHTFATTITLSNEVPLEVVSQWLGHTDIKTSRIYAKITNQYSGKMADKLDGKI